MSNSINGVGNSIIRDLTGAGNPRNTVGNDSKTQASQDEVALTDRAARLDSLIKLAQESPDVDAQKVAQMKASVDSGGHSVNHDRIAEQLIATESQLP